jgi:hypothetical protein
MPCAFFLYYPPLFYHPLVPKIYSGLKLPLVSHSHWLKTAIKLRHEITVFGICTSTSGIFALFLVSLSLHVSLLLLVVVAEICQVSTKDDSPSP